jgi:arylsulfatase A-like enzyme
MSDARSIAGSLPSYGFTAVHSSPERIALLKDRYDESISEVDFHVERAIALLKQKLGANTAFIITADHGESFSHGYGGHGGPMLYQDVIHIPLLIEFPERLQAGLRQPANVSQADIAPTIADIAGIPPDPSWEGHSLLKTESVDTHRPIYSMNFEENVADGQLKNGSIALMRDGFKLVRFFGTLRYPDMPELTTQLFNLQSDPEEQHNLAADHPDIVKALSAVMDADFAKHAGAITKSSDSSTVKLH